MNNNLLKSFLVAALAYGAVRFFGPLEAVVGYGVGYLVYKQLVKRQATGQTPLIAGVAAGIVVALALAVAFSVALYNG